MVEDNPRKLRPIIMRVPSDTGNFSRILRPGEFEKLLRAVVLNKPEYAPVITLLLATGMRYKEIERFHAHPEWFYAEDHVIDPLADKPLDAILSLKKKEAGTSALRKIYLSDWGVKVTKEFLRQTAGQDIPSFSRTDKVLNNIAMAAGFEVYEGLRHFAPVVKDVNGKSMKDKETGKRTRVPKDFKVRVTGVSQKALRKTWISWLLTVFPEYEGKITDSMGHSSAVERRHYRSLSFAEDDIRQIWRYVDGFIPDKRMPETMKEQKEMKE